MHTALTLFQSRAGDHNDLAIPGAQSIAASLSKLLDVEAFKVGTPEPALSADWSTELGLAHPALRALQNRFEQIYGQGKCSVAAISRCAVSLATLPVVAKYFPHACVVWFDAHADLNTPESSLSGFLGGMALSGPAGLWNSGLGSGLALDNIVLVGQRDMDAFEEDLIKTHGIRCIPPGGDLPGALKQAVGGRAVYMHLDCDVLNPGIVPTDYVCANGLSLEDLYSACEALACSDIVGVEIAEFQNSWTLGGAPVSPAPLLEALRPVLGKITE
jgi:hypothetical protein